MADIVVDNAVNSLTFNHLTGRCLVWTSKTTGYIFFIDSSLDFHYRKTTNSGASWGTEATIRTGTITNIVIWYDKWTNGDTGTIIHIAFTDGDDDNITYNSLDTSDDSLGGDVVVLNGASALTGGNWDDHCLAITKSRGGNIYVGGWIDTSGERGFWRATQSPATSFTSRANVTDGNAVDLIIFDSGNEADNNDIWCFYWDASANTISLKIYDNSENSWSETTISTGMNEITFEFQMDSCHRHSDNHSILVAWDGYGSGGNQVNLKVWDIGGSGSIISKTNVVTNTAENANVGIMINQQNDDLYVAYLAGTDLTSLVDAVFQKSTDGGGTWGGEQSFSVGTNDDLRVITGGTSVENAGGRFMPVWFNDDLNDLFTNKDNSIEIAAVSVGTNLQINISDVWKEVPAVQINISDVWKSVVGMQINIGDSWKSIF